LLLLLNAACLAEKQQLSVYFTEKIRVIVILFVRITWSLLLPGKNKISKTKETAVWTCSVCKIDVGK
jgi:hypothetical protein